MAIFTGTIWIVASLIIPETYAPYILRKRAQRLSKTTGKVYISGYDADRPARSAAHHLKATLTRPWVLLFKEPIILILSIYISIIYGTMYMCFAAFPIVFQGGRGWNQGVGGLAFLGIVVGVALAILTFVYEDKRYAKAGRTRGAPLEPEDRLPPAMVGSVLIPVGLFWFAWTSFDSIHWIVPIIGTVFFAWGLVLVFMALLNYLIDSCKRVKPPTPSSANRHQMLSSLRPSWQPTQSFDPFSALPFPCLQSRCTRISVFTGQAPCRHSWHWHVYLFRSCSSNMGEKYG